MRFIYPASYEDIKVPEAMYAEEVGYLIAKRRIPCLTFSMEQFELGTFKKYGIFENDQELYYRGWMLTPANYERLYKDILSCGSKMAVSPESYRASHHLPEWYPLIRDFTAETHVIHNYSLMRCDELNKKLHDFKWGKCFVKDYVKSLSSEHSSIATNGEEIIKIAKLIEKYRGHIEGGLCLRAFEDYKPNSEFRYFVFKGKVFGASGKVPKMIIQVANILNSRSPFFSIDIAERKDGELRVIEIGDGQVSDLKHWKAEQFINIF